MNRYTHKVIEQMNQEGLNFVADLERVYEIAALVAEGVDRCDELQAALMVAEIIDDLNQYDMMREEVDLDEYERIDERECWMRYGWGTESKEGTEILHRVDGEREIFCNELRDEYAYDGRPCYGCEIYEVSKDGEMLGQWFDNTPEKAIAGAMLEWIL